MNYTVKIMSAKISEINNVNKALRMDLWEGVTVSCPELAKQIARDAKYVEPLIDVEVV